VVDAVIKPSLRWRTVSISCWVCGLTGDENDADDNDGDGLEECVGLRETVADEGTEDDPDWPARFGALEPELRYERAVLEEEAERAWVEGKGEDVEGPRSARGGIEKARLAKQRRERIEYMMKIKGVDALEVRKEGVNKERPS
jgi:hypothetical protein